MPVERQKSTDEKISITAVLIRNSSLLVTVGLVYTHTHTHLSLTSAVGRSSEASIGKFVE